MQPFRSHLENHTPAESSGHRFGRFIRIHDRLERVSLCLYVPG